MYNTFMKLSPQQQHLCALQQGEESFPYDIYYAVRLEGKLDVSRLGQAFSRLVERYEILRACFPRLPGLTLPVQVINGDMPLPFVVYDCCSLSPHEQEEALVQLREARRGRPFSLESGPLWQVVLVICNVDQHWLLWELSGLCADTQSCHLLLLELSQLYEEGWSGAEVRDLPPYEEPLQYADLAGWQHELLESAETATGREYWQFLEQARDQGAPLGQNHEGLLPNERHLDGHLPFTPRSLAITLSPDELTRLGVLAQQLDVAPAALLLACWGAVLSRLSTQTESWHKAQDLLIGTGYSGREYEDLAGVVGPLAKSLPLSYQFLENARFTEVVGRSAATMREASEWQEYFGWQLLAPHVAPGGQEPYCSFGFNYETLPVPWPTEPQDRDRTEASPIRSLSLLQVQTRSFGMW